MKISVIVSTYNWPEALECALSSLNRQSDRDFEVVIADDGSTSATTQLIESMQEKFTVPLTHVWQEDRGFRRSAILNKAIKRASGDYLIFMDGDCIARLNFVASHRRLVEEGCFVTGSRILVSEEYSKKVTCGSVDITTLPLLYCMTASMKGDINKFTPLLNLPIIRTWNPKKWSCLRGCNFGVWKKDIVSVNGFEEAFVGWGFEDSELAVRLINRGLKRKSGKFATAVFHLWHPVGNTSKSGPNWDLLTQRIEQHSNWTDTGLNRA